MEWLKYVRELCDKHGIMLIFDEVQTGFGRTGNLYAWQTLGVEPDIFTSAKAIAGGLPLSAVFGKKEIMDKWAEAGVEITELTPEAAAEFAEASAPVYDEFADELTPELIEAFTSVTQADAGTTEPAA